MNLLKIEDDRKIINFLFYLLFGKCLILDKWLYEILI